MSMPSALPPSGCRLDPAQLLGSAPALVGLVPLPLLPRRGWLRPVAQRHEQVRALEVYQRDHVVEVAKAPGHPYQCLDGGVAGLALGAVGLQAHGAQYALAVAGDLLRELLHRREAAGRGVLHPLVEPDGGLVGVAHVQDQPQPLLELVGRPEVRLLGLDERNHLVLVGRPVLRAVPERVLGALDRLGRVRPPRLRRRREPDLVEGAVGPSHDVEEVDAADGVGEVLRDALVDPAGAVAGHDLDPRALHVRIRRTTV